MSTVTGTCRTNWVIWGGDGGRRFTGWRGGFGGPLGGGLPGGASDVSGGRVKPGCQVGDGGGGGAVVVVTIPTDPPLVVPTQVNAVS